MPPTILLVQPDPAQARRLHQLLFDLGHESRTVGHAEEALTILKGSDKIDMVVLELGLPGVDGFQLLSELRKFRDASKTAVVVITAFPGLMFRAIREKRDLGIEAVFSAKATAVSLHEVFGKVMGQRAAQAPKPMSIPLAAFSQLAAGKEAKRLARIATLHLSGEMDVDDALAKLAKDIALSFDFPVVLVSLLVQDKLHFKAHRIAKDPRQSAKPAAGDWSSLVREIDEANGQLQVIPDARKHPFFKQHPLVAAGEVLSYSSAPVTSSENAALGSITLIDHKPRQLSGTESDMLIALTRRISGELEVQQRMRHLKQDLSRQWDKLAQHAEQMEMLKAILETLHLGILLFDSQKRIVLANQRLCELTGFERSAIESGDSEAFAVDLLSLFDDPDEVSHKLMVLEEGPYAATEIFAMQRPKRQYIRWTARPVHVGEQWYQLSTYEDISAEIELEVERERLSTLDPVTGLLNRRAAEEEGIREAGRSKRKKRHFTLLRLTLDGLSDVNAEKGFDAGDALLHDVADCMRDNLRMEDRPGRWGGRQFLILLPETGEPEARLVARRIADAVSKIDVGLPLTLSGGLAVCDKKYDFAGTLELADQRLALALANTPGEIL